MENSKIVYSFLEDKRLIISKDGNGKEADWEFFIDSDTIAIKEEHMTIYNCSIIFEEFMSLNKDNSDEIILFANKTKYTNYSKLEIENKFTKLFEKISDYKNLNTLELIFIIRLYELQGLFKQGKDKNKVVHLLDRMVNTSTDIVVFNNFFNKLFGISVLRELQYSAFSNTSKNQIASILLAKGIISKTY